MVRRRQGSRSAAEDCWWRAAAPLFARGECRGGGSGLGSGAVAEAKTGEEDSASDTRCDATAPQLNLRRPVPNARKSEPRDSGSGAGWPNVGSTPRLLHARLFPSGALESGVRPMGRVGSGAAACRDLCSQLQPARRLSARCVCLSRAALSDCRLFSRSATSYAQSPAAYAAAWPARTDSVGADSNADPARHLPPTTLGSSSASPANTMLFSGPAKGARCQRLDAVLLSPFLPLPPSRRALAANQSLLSGLLSPCFMDSASHAVRNGQERLDLLSLCSRRSRRQAFGSAPGLGNDLQEPPRRHAAG